MRAIVIAAALILSTAASPGVLGAAQKAAEPVEGLKVGAGVGFVFTIDLGTADGEVPGPARVAAMAGLAEEAPQEAGEVAEEDPAEEAEVPAEEAYEEVYEGEVYEGEVYEGEVYEEEEQVYDEKAAAEAVPAEGEEQQEELPVEEPSEDEGSVEEPAEDSSVVEEPAVAEPEAPPPA